MSPSTGTRRMWLLVLFFGLFAPRALADFAVCQPSWGWANNSLNQNPCQVAGALEAECEGFSSYVLGPLGPGSNYVTPQTNSSTQKCQCNTVMYSLYMACTGCQNSTIQSWTFWSQYCTGVYIAAYPQPIPPYTAVPHWAFLNWSIGTGFDPTEARAAGGPESTAPVPSTISLPTGSTGSRSLPLTTAMPAGTSTGQGSDNQTGNSSHTGAIAGGVVGGLLGLAVIGAGVWIFLRKRAKARAGLGYPDYTSVATGAPVSDQGHITPSSQRLYDPSDPSTFPSYTDYEASGPYTTQPNRGHYSGVPEL